ncbi:DUF3887 domain-containing protein [Pendulispora albinea]|uniref:DUF3887 domain-containing protein n=1 Tax=Pendulispora albinea TaxID=2741071 RepID=A0ABZ2M863_9BACT
MIQSRTISFQHAYSVALLATACSSPQVPARVFPKVPTAAAVSTPLDVKARTFLEELGRSEWEHPRSAFTARLSNALPPSKLQSVWRSVESSAGPFHKVSVTEMTDGSRVVRAVCRFDRATLTFKITYDTEARVAGFYVLPPPSSSTWVAPPYADPEAFEEREVKVGTQPALPGVVSVPKGAGPFPAAVLVHGSGPMDRDESVGGVKVFKDFAWAVGRG